MKMLNLDTQNLLNTILASLQESYQNSPVQEGVKEVGENIYVVLVVTMLVWLGLFVYMLMMDKRVKNVEGQIEKLTK
ncbi:MAG: CcmD family protein [Calditrichota bacterium]